LAEHFGDVEGVGVVVAEEVAEAVMVLFEDVGFEVGDFVGELGAGEVKEEGAGDDGHFDGAEVLVFVDELRDCVCGDGEDSFAFENVIDCKLASEAIVAVEEFDGGESIGAKDKTILAGAWAKESE